MIFFCGQNNFANAQDVYAGNTGGLDFYVDTNTIVPTDSLGAYYWKFYVKVKKIEQDTGALRDINQWTFYCTPDQRDHWSWSFDYYLSGKGIPVESNHIAKNILGICKRYDKRIM